MRTGITITVTPADRRRLEAITRDRNATQKHARRAAIVLLSADGVGTNEVMRRTGKSKTCIWRWQERFMQEGVDGLLRLMLPGETARRWFCLLRLDGIAPRNRISCCAPSEAVLILVRGSHELIWSRGLGQKGAQP